MKAALIKQLLCGLSGMLAATLAACTVAATMALNADLQQGADKLAESDLLAQQADAHIRDSNRLRKQIKQARRASPAAGSSAPVESAQLRKLTERSLKFQHRGSELRQQAARLRANARQQLQAGLQQAWPQWFTQNGPIELSDSLHSAATVAVAAHNTPQRSVHPMKQGMAGNPATGQPPDMSLDVAEMAAQQVPRGLDTGSTVVSRDRKFLAHIEVVRASVANAAGKLAINEMHNWHLLLTDLKGAPVSAATVTFNGHMPGHVHGLPTQPHITRELAPGVYEVSGVKFQMRGWWVIEFSVNAVGESSEAGDSARFNIHL